MINRIRSEATLLFNNFIIYPSCNFFFRAETWKIKMFCMYICTYIQKILKHDWLQDIPQWYFVFLKKHHMKMYENTIIFITYIINFPSISYAIFFENKISGIRYVYINSEAWRSIFGLWIQQNRSQLRQHGPDCASKSS